MEYPRTKSVTIASGASLSNAVDLEGYVVCGVQMPAAWTAADVTFQASSDSGNTWQELTDATDGAAVTAKVAASTVAALDVQKTVPALRLRVRSGTAAVPVAQAADRVVTLLMRPVG